MVSPKKSQKKLMEEKTAVRKALDEQYLEGFRSIIERDPANPKKFICIPCKENKSTYHSGTWYNLLNHLATSTHETNIKGCEQHSEEAKEEENNQKSEQKDLQIKVSAKTLNKNTSDES